MTRRGPRATWRVCRVADLRVGDVYRHSQESSLWFLAVKIPHPSQPNAIACLQIERKHLMGGLCYSRLNGSIWRLVWE